MIEQSFASTKPKPVYQTPAYTSYTGKKNWATPHETANALSRGITVTEWLRRDEIVRNLWKNHLYNPGDTVYCSNPADHVQYGGWMVVGMCKSYSDIDIKEEWPQNDAPLVLQIRNLADRTKVYHCNVEYITKRNPEC